MYEVEGLGGEGGGVVWDKTSGNVVAACSCEDPAQGLLSPLTAAGRGNRDE